MVYASQTEASPQQKSAVVGNILQLLEWRLSGTGLFLPDDYCVFWFPTRVGCVPLLLLVQQTEAI